MIIAISVTLFFIVIRLTVTLFNFISNPKLTRVSRHYDDQVSILIPARNEEDNITALLQSISLQDYKNYEVIVYDDESSDKTYKICSAFAAKHEQFRVIKGGELPDVWTGKNYACSRLAEEAKGKYFLFLDADTTIADGLLNSAVHRMQLYKLGLLSLLPNQTMKTFGENAVVPLVHYIVLNLVPVRLVYLIKSSIISTACGQFMLFDAAIYRQNKWHEKVKSEVLEDVEIMRQVKTTKHNGELLLANGMISCRMFRNYEEAINGFSKSSLAAVNYNIIGFLVYILLQVAAPMVVIMTLNFQLIFFMAGLIILTRIMISLSAGQNAWYNILLHPIQMANLVIVGFLSIQRYLTKTLTWKGRKI